MKIFTSFSKKMVLAVVGIIFLSAIIVGCRKDNTAPEDSMKIAEKLSGSTEFKILVSTMSDFKRTLNNNRVQNDFNHDITTAEAKAVDTKSKLRALLLKLGFNNSSDVEQATEHTQLAVGQVFKQFPQLYKLQKEEVLAIFMEAKMIRAAKALDGVIQVKRNDICSQGYADGKEACSNALGWDLVLAGVGGILAIPATPIASATTVLSLAAVAYLKEHDCNSHVVNAWRTCRIAHPL